MAHLLVTGGAGYIGSHALRALERAGHTAFVIDDLRAGRAEAVGRAPLVRCDVADGEAVARALEAHGPVDGVLHFAASLSVADSVADPLGYVANNVTGSARLLEQVVAHGARAFVLSSTAATYGHPETQPIAESTPLAPINPYGASKAMVERILADVERAHGLRWAALRYFNACGAEPDGSIGECHEPETHLIPAALEAAASLRPKLSLYGTDYPTPDGTCIRDYVHVTDLGEAHVRAIEGLLADGPGGPFNLATGTGLSNREILSGIEDVIGKAVPFEEAPRRPGDPPVLVADASRFRKSYGWEPQHSDLETIVETAWAWLRSWKGL